MAKTICPFRNRIMADWKALCVKIGVRLAGTENEWEAAEYILKRFKEAGCDFSDIETFACNSRTRARVSVEIRANGRWKAVQARVLTGVSSTAQGKPVTGKLEWLEMPEQVGLLKKDSLKGKIAMIFGKLPENLGHHRRLVNARPSAVIHIDERLPFSWPKNDGTYPLWAKKCGYPPMVTVPYTDAWRWRKDGVTTARVSVDIKMIAAESTNVVAELSGSDPRAGMILLGAHHDSQAGNVGADDNASGVVCLLELARMLKPVKCRRTIRFVSFGTEEQLSVGSAAYVSAHAAEMKKIALMINFDSVASVLGHAEMHCIGGKALLEFGLKQMRAGGINPVSIIEVCPFCDHFPFAVYGVPALWFHRVNMPGGRWQHHSVHDNLDNVSPEIVAGLLTAVAKLIVKAADADTLPFPRSIEPHLRSATREYARTLYGMRD